MRAVPRERLLVPLAVARSLLLLPERLELALLLPGDALPRLVLVLLRPADDRLGEDDELLRDAIACSLVGWRPAQGAPCLPANLGSPAARTVGPGSASV